MLINDTDRANLKRNTTNMFPDIQFVRKVYMAIGNYCKIPVGAGKGLATPFNLQDFARTFRFPVINAFNAIKILQNEGYVELSDEMNNPSRVHFTVMRDDLYKFQVANAGFDAFIKLLLRSYNRHV
ncbi:MAG: hypothetical protein HC896_02840 [Bacteroidales bacterium]|nr:hypothetical protein [Bacteroidales bacterium]